MILNLLLYIWVKNRRKFMNTLIGKFIYFKEQIRILHWQTKEYARHMAYGSFYSTLDDLTDNFIETYQGKYGRINFEGAEPVEFKNISDIKINDFLNELISFLSVDLTDQLKSDVDTDLLNIRDEMLGATNKLKYLLTLK